MNIQKIFSTVMLMIAPVSSSFADEIKSAVTDQGYWVVAEATKIENTDRVFLYEPEVSTSKSDWSQKVFLRPSEPRKLCRLLGFKTNVVDSEVVYRFDGFDTTKIKNPEKHIHKRGEVLAGVMCSNKAFDSFDENEKMTTTGAVFTQVDEPSLGEAWRTPDGTIWGEIVPGLYRLQEAEDYCKAIGARLPSDDDAAKLMKFFKLGYGSLPQILPGILQTVVLSNTFADQFSHRYYYVLKAEWQWRFRLTTEIIDDYDLFQFRCVK